MTRLRGGICGRFLRGEARGDAEAEGRRQEAEGRRREAARADAEAARAADLEARLAELTRRHENGGA